MEKDGNQYYTHIVVYVYGIIFMDKNLCRFIYMLNDNYTVKPSIIRETNLYLGKYIWKEDYGNGSYEWTMILDSYE